MSKRKTGRFFRCFDVGGQVVVTVSKCGPRSLEVRAYSEHGHIADRQRMYESGDTRDHVFEHLCDGLIKPLIDLVINRAGAVVGALIEEFTLDDSTIVDGGCDEE